jgi:ABC-type uncharacterized transport system permease subunit
MGEKKRPKSHAGPPIDHSHSSSADAPQSSAVAAIATVITNIIPFPFLICPALFAFSSLRLLSYHTALRWFLILLIPSTLLTVLP